MKTRIVLIVMLAFLSWNGMGQTIVLDSLAREHYCPGGDSMMVGYTCTGTFFNGNVFTVQLSDAYGSFANPQVIGSLASITSDTIHCLIPANDSGGGRYNIRICSSSPYLISTPLNDSIYIDDFIPIILAYGYTTICSDDSVILWNVTAGSFIAYQWYLDNVAIPGATNAEYTANTEGFYSLVLTNHCLSHLSINPIYVAVNQAPNLSIIADTVICINANTGLMASGAYSYAWTPSSSLNATNSPDVIATPTSQTTYTVTGTNINGCTATESITIHVSQLPNVHAYSAYDTICNGITDMLTATGCDLYSWSPVNTLNVFNNDTVYATPTTTTVYYVLGKNNGCTQISEDSVKVVVLQGPTISITGNDTICFGGSTILTASGGNNYLWSPFIGLQDSINAVELANPATTILYTVSSSDSNGCIGRDTFKLNVIDCSGIHEISERNSISIYPNPFTYQTTLTLQGSYHSPTLFIYNLIGQEVRSLPIGTNNQITIQRNQLPAGMYFYKVIEDNKEVLGVGKMVVE